MLRVLSRVGAVLCQQSRQTFSPEKAFANMFVRTKHTRRTPAAWQHTRRRWARGGCGAAAVSAGYVGVFVLQYICLGLIPG